MKILMIFKRWKGGVGVVIENISSELKKLGHEVDVISREDDLKIHSLIKSIRPLREKVKELIKKENYDIIYTHDWSLAFPLIFPRPIYKEKHFCCFYGTQQNIMGTIQVIVGRIMKDHLIVAGDQNKRRLHKSILIPNAVNMKDFRPLSKRRNYLGWTKKETEMLTEEDVIRLGKKLNIPVLIAKGIPHKKMNEFYNKCKIFISLPPISSGSALSWMEAMSAGVPRIIGNQKGDGSKLPIDKMEDYKNLNEAILNSKKRNYRKWLKDKKITWEMYVKRLVKVFEKK